MPAVPWLYRHILGFPGRKQPVIICLFYDTGISYELEGESRYG
jgi:hypothetical protein